MSDTSLTTFEAWSDSFTPFLGQEAGQRYYRAQAIGQNGYQIWFSFSSDAATFDPEGFNPAQVSIFVQDRIGEVIGTAKLDIPVTTGFKGGGGNAILGFGLDSAASIPTLKTGLVWFDYKDGTYSLKYQAAKIIVSDLINVMTSEGMGSLEGSVKTLASGLAVPNDYGWSSTNTNFAFMIDTPIAGTTNKTIQIRSFDLDGKALATQSVVLPQANYTLFTGLPDGRHALIQEDNTAINNAALVFKTFDATTGVLDNYATIYTGLKDISATNFASVTDPNNSSSRNTLLTVGGRDPSGNAVVKFLLIDSNGLTLNSFSINTNNIISRIQEIVLSDVQTTITGFQDGQILHLVQVDGAGRLVVDNQQLSATATFDRLRNLSDGRFEVVWREPGSETNELLIKAKIYDARSEGTPILSTSGSNMLAGTRFADTIDGGNGNDIIAGGAGADVLIGGAGVDTLSYGTTNTSVTVNLASNTASGGVANGDIISGFENLIGSEASDVLTGDSNANIIFGGYGNDTISGLGADDWLFGQAGNDTIDGGSGTDEAVYTGTSYNYTITKTSTGYIIKDLRAGSPDGTDTLLNIEGFSFSNGYATPTSLKNMEVWSDEFTPFSSTEAGGRFSRLSVTAFSGNQFLVGLRTDAASHAAPGLKQGSLFLFTQDRVGNVLTSEDLKIPVTTGLGASSGSYGVGMVNFGLDTSQSVQTVKTGIIWLDYVGDSYSLKFKPIHFTPNDSINTGNFYSFPSEAKTVATNFINPSNFEWASNSTSFIFAAETMAPGASTKSVRINGFDSSGNLLSSKIFDMPASAFKGFFTTSSGNYIFVEEDNSNPTNALFTGKLFDPVSGSLELVATIATGLKDIVSILFSSLNDPTDASAQNILFAVSGIDQNGSSTVKFILNDGSQNLLKELSFTTNSTISRFQQIVLNDGASSVTGFQDGEILRLIQMDGFGSIVVEEAITLPTGALFDRLRSFNDGRFEVLWREPGSETNELILKAQIYDTRPAGTTINGNANNNLLAGTNYADTIDGGDGNDVIAGGRLGDVLIGGNGTDTLSYANSLTGVTVNLNTNTASGGNASGDVISGFEHLIGSEGSDSLTGTSSSNVIAGFGGNDSLYGLGGDDWLFGDAGNDLLDGGSGFDVTTYAHKLSNYKLTKTSSGFIVSDLRKGSPDGTDTLINMDKISFSDARAYDSLAKYYTITYRPGSLDIFSKLRNEMDEADFTANSFIFSDQNIDMSYFEKTASLSQSSVKSLVELYIASFNRAPDAMGLNYWGSQLASGAMDLGQIAKSFFVQPETVAAYPASQSVEVFVDRVYNNVLSRSPDGSGMAYWKEAIESGRISKDVFLLAIINGAKAETGSAADKQTLINKTAVGMDFAFQEGLSNVTWAKDVMASVNATPSSVQAAYQKTDSYAALAATSNTAELAIQLVGIWDSAPT